MNIDPSARFPTVVVRRADISHVQVVLGVQGGIVEGDLRDSATQGVIAGGEITVRDLHHPEAFVKYYSDKAGHFQFAVPSKPLRLSATAPGYATTVLDQGNEFALSGGEHKKVTLELQRR